MWYGVACTKIISLSHEKFATQNPCDLPTSANTEIFSLF